MTKLPCCENCYETLCKVNRETKEHINESDVSESAILKLPYFAFKIRDFGRIPEGLPQLNHVERTAIAPFVAFTRVTQLRKASNLHGGSQSSMTGTGFSVPTEALTGKEFIIPLGNHEFVKSFSRELPRHDVASRHRIYFMGNQSN